MNDWMKKQIDIYKVNDYITPYELVGKKFFKISKSSPDIRKLCSEEHYIEYCENSLIQDKKEQWLSFVPSTHVIYCITYGDQLTEIIFNPNDVKFNKIADKKIIYGGLVFEEYRAKSLITGKNYSLRDVETIQKIIDMTPINTLKWFASCDEYMNKHSVKEHLTRLGFKDSLTCWLSNIQKISRM